jgi:hypothetical protein
MMKKHIALFTVIGISVAAAAYLANRLDLFHDEAVDYAKFDTSRR